jgi:hypothetical protein
MDALRFKTEDQIFAEIAYDVLMRMAQYSGEKDIKMFVARSHKLTFALQRAEETKLKKSDEMQLLNYFKPKKESKKDEDATSQNDVKQDDDNSLNFLPDPSKMKMSPEEIKDIVKEANQNLKRYGAVLFKTSTLAKEIGSELLKLKNIRNKKRIFVDQEVTAKKKPKRKETKRDYRVHYNLGQPTSSNRTSTRSLSASKTSGMNLAPDNIEEELFEKENDETAPVPPIRRQLFPSDDSSRLIQADPIVMDRSLTSSKKERDLKDEEEGIIIDIDKEGKNHDHHDQAVEDTKELLMWGSVLKSSALNTLRLRSNVSWRKKLLEVFDMKKNSSCTECLSEDDTSYQLSNYSFPCFDPLCQKRGLYFCLKHYQHTHQYGHAMFDIAHEVANP